MATPRHQPTDRTRKQVEDLAGFGLTQPQVCRVLGVSLPTLLKYYRAELDAGAAKATAAVAETLFQKAVSGDTACMIFWLKARAGWSERTIVQGGKDAEPIRVEADVGAAAAAALGALMEQLAAAKARGGDDAGKGLDWPQAAGKPAFADPSSESSPPRRV
jgi:hypothetical protein